MTTSSLVETQSGHVLVITMSRKQLHRLEVIQHIRDRRRLGGLEQSHRFAPVVSIFSASQILISD